MAKFTSVIALTAAICCALPASSQASVASAETRAGLQQPDQADARLWQAAYRPGYRPGRPGRPHYRPPHRHNRGNGAGTAIAAGAVGLVLGAAIASSNRYSPPATPLPYGEVDTYTQPYQGHDWHQYCASKFSTYDPRSGMYLASDGQRYPCH